MALPSEHVWFEDGNIIVRAENTLFKVFKGVLAQNSPIFKDMFGSAHIKASELVEGIPVVDVFDAADDWKHLLLAIFEHPYFEAQALTDIMAFLGILRLSKKYEIIHFRDPLLKRLYDEWPTAMEVWNGLASTMAEMSYGGWNRRIMAIPFLRELGLDSCLPSAFLELVMFTPFDQIFEGARNSSYPLTLDDVQICVVGWTNLYEEVRKSHLSQLAPNFGITGCPTDACKHAALNGYFALCTLMESRKTGPMTTLWSSESKRRRILSLCESCTAQFCGHYENARLKTWEKLPEMFGLPSWDILKQGQIGI